MPAGVGIDVSEPDTDELAGPDPGIRQGLDQHGVAGAAGPVCNREWNQVTAPGEDYDRECLVALDPPFAGLLAPGNVVTDPNDEELTQAMAEAQDLGLDVTMIQQLGGLTAVETDERCVPAALHPPFGETVRPGDRIAAIGQWIIDAAHTAAVEPDTTPQLPEGGISFRSEVHPPLLRAIGGTRVLTPTDIRTRIVLTSRPFLARAPSARLDAREH